MIDLNRFVPKRSHLTVTDGETINNRGEIAASGMLPNGDFHAVVLIPCNGDRGATTAAATKAPGKAHRQPARRPWRALH